MQDRKQIQREAIKVECLRRHIAIIARGQGYALHGPGVDLMCASLELLTVTDLAPFIPRNEKQAA